MQNLAGLEGDIGSDNYFSLITPLLLLLHILFTIGVQPHLSDTGCSLSFVVGKIKITITYSL